MRRASLRHTQGALAAIQEMQDITSKIELYINEQNASIWNELKKEYSFKLYLDHTETSWKGKTDGNTAIIIAPTEIIEYHSFTHELLHIYLDFLGLSTLEEVIHNIVGEYAFSFLLNTDLTSWIYNFSSHKKMFPFYKSMGFSEESFVQESISFTKRDFIYIKDTSKSRKTICESIDQYIGHTISLMNNVVKSDEAKCLKYLEKLKELKPNLFKIILDFDTKWNDSLDYNLAEKFADFGQELNDYLIKRKIKCGDFINLD